MAANSEYMERVRDFLELVHAEVYRANLKFPTNDHRMFALTEEVGEFSRALLATEYNEDRSKSADLREEAIKEAVQTAAMVIRLALESDASLTKFKPF